MILPWTGNNLPSFRVSFSFDINLLKNIKDQIKKYMYFQRIERDRRTRDVAQQHGRGLPQRGHDGGVTNIRL